MTVREKKSGSPKNETRSSEIQVRVRDLVTLHMQGRSNGEIARKAEEYRNENNLGPQYSVSKQYLQKVLAGNAPVRPSLPKLIVMSATIGIPMDALVKAYSVLDGEANAGTTINPRLADQALGEALGKINEARRLLSDI